MTKRTNERSGRGIRFSRWSGLQARMTTSYIWVTAVTMLILLSLYTMFLTAEVGYTLSQERMGTTTRFPPLTTYPLQGALVMILVMALVTPLIGGFFGTMTTRGMVDRVRTLVAATAQFANGQYAQRVGVIRNDEIGQLEDHFNRMAAQLAESIAQREVLAEQNARLAERARISRELHDAISQDLFSLRMATGGLQTAVVPCSQALELQPYLETVQEATTSMMREMRALLLELRPGQLEHLGLAAALEELATAYRTRLGITVNTSILPVQLDAKAEHALLRIVQEAFTNAVRHADATVITLDLRPLAPIVECIITDNGKGFEQAEHSASHGMGLHLMQERTQELHGTFSLSTAPGQGTRIHIRLP